jgi:hypothetical protein
MSFDVSPLAGSYSAASAVDRVRAARANDRASFSDAVASAGTTPPIPAEVWDQVDAASRLADHLQAQGRSVRFDVHKLDGGVVASLVDDEAGLLRPLLLEHVIDPSRLSDEVGGE